MLWCAPQDITLRLDSDHLLKHALTQAQRAAGGEIVGCDRVRFMLHARALNQPRVLRELRIQRDVCSAGSYFSDVERECIDCMPCSKAASAGGRRQCCSVARAPDHS